MVLAVLLRSDFDDTQSMTRTIGFAMAASFMSTLAPAAELSEPVRLPAIFHKWGPEGTGNDLPETSMDEISRCIGTDQGLSRNVRDLKVAAAQLDRDLEGLKASRESLTAARDRVSAEQEALAVEAESLRARSIAIDKARTLIDARNRKGVRDQAEAKRLKSDIDAFNREVAAHNEASRSLQDRVKEAALRVDEYNRAAAEFRARAEPVSQRVAQYEAQSAQFNKRLASFKSKCEGERRIVK